MNNKSFLKMLVDDIIEFLHKIVYKYKDVSLKEILLAFRVVSRILILTAREVRKDYEDKKKV